MADLNFTLTTAEVSVAAGVAKTILQAVAAANHRVRVHTWGYYMKGGSTSAKARLLRQTTAGTMSALVPAKTGTESETIQTTGLHTATAEPTAGDVLATKEGPSYEGEYTPGREVKIPGAGRLGVEITADSTGDVVVWMACEE